MIMLSFVETRRCGVFYVTAGNQTCNSIFGQYRCFVVHLQACFPWNWTCDSGVRLRRRKWPQICIRCIIIGRKFQVKIRTRMFGSGVSRITTTRTYDNVYTWCIVVRSPEPRVGLLIFAQVMPQIVDHSFYRTISPLVPPIYIRA